jgi:TonB family protein
MILWMALMALAVEVKPLPGNMPCAYPPRAQKVQVVGPVAFTAQVRPDGSVESVAVTQVPHPGLDFEDAVKACVGAWRFEPAASSDAGLRPYEGRMRFRLLPAEEAALRALLESFASAWNAGDGAALAELALTRADSRAIPAGDLPKLAEQLKAEQGSGAWRMELEPEVPYMQFLRPDLVSLRQPYRHEAAGEEPRGDVLEAKAMRGARGWRFLTVEPRVQIWLNARRVGGEIREPLKLKDVRPVYPSEAKRARIQGVVILECLITPQGKVGELKVLRGIPLLDEAAVDAVRQWEYTPTLLNGEAVPVIMTVTVNFRLS